MPAAEGDRAVRSIYEQALGREFDRLHPHIQRRFGFSSREGTFDVEWKGVTRMPEDIRPRREERRE
jgi:hypothetical protein